MWVEKAGLLSADHRRSGRKGRLQEIRLPKKEEDRSEMNRVSRGLRGGLTEGSSGIVRRGAWMSIFNAGSRG